MEMINSMIYDYETLGQDVVNCPVLSMAVFAFDTDRFISNPYTLNEIVDGSTYVKFDVNEQVKVYKRVIEASTLDWWKTQSKEAQRSQLKAYSTDVSITEMPDVLASIYTTEAAVYTRGNTFDPIITETMCKIMNKPSPYPWWSIRDTRSMIDGLSYGSNISNSFVPDSVDWKDVVVHVPRYDIALDVLRLQVLIQAIS